MHTRVAILGTGFGGLGAARRLAADGHDVTLFERADSVGGVWRDNVYPGAACDVESRLYELDGAPHGGWTRRFARQPEIRAYLERVAEPVRDRIRFSTEVTRAVWDEAAARWQITTTQGDWTADVIVSATGALAEPRLPDLPGLDTFAGDVMHTARWDETVALDGRSVAVVGTGASAIQVVPAIAPRVARLTVFQRTPAWVIPRRDGPLRTSLPLAVRRVLRRVVYGRHEVQGLPFRHPRLAAVVARAIDRHLARQVPDAALRARLRPPYAVGCKRILLSDDYYPALARPNVAVTGAATRVTPGGIVDADGTEHAADVLVFATGFHVHDLPIADRLVGRDGRTLAATWAGAPVAHVGTTVAGFPNLFLLQGPNTGLGHSSVLLMMEAQIEHLAGALAWMDATGAAAVEPRLEAQAAFVDDVDCASAHTVWMTGCQSWYLDATGRNAAVWPRGVGAFQRRVAPFDASEYRVRTGAAWADGPADVRPSALDRAKGAGGRALRRVPTAAVAALGVPVVVDGQTLDPHLHLLLRIEPPQADGATFRADPLAVRARLRRETAAVRGAPTRVGSARDLPVGGAAGPLPARLYRPAGVARPPLTVYYHGGGFCEGSLDTHDEPCRVLCRQSGHAVLSVAYRLAPEHPFPAAVDDAVAAFRWTQAHAAALGADPEAVAVAGDSAGGCLAAVVAQATAGDRPPVAQLLLYPATDVVTHRPSRDLFDGYLLADSLRAAFFDVYTDGTDADPSDPRLSPLCAPRLDGLAPALVSTAGFDVLRDEGEAYGAALAAAGVPVASFREPGLPHGWLHLTDVVPTARLAAVATARQWRRFVAERAAPLAASAGDGAVGAPRLVAP